MVEAGRSGLSASASRSGTRIRKNDNASSKCSFDNTSRYVTQFTTRDHTKKIFQHPFLYLAADTGDVMAATDPRKEENFRWHNMGLTNKPTNAAEYPVEFLPAILVLPGDGLRPVTREDIRSI